MEAQEAEISEAMITISKLEEILEEIDALLEEKKVEEGKQLLEEIQESDFFAFVKKDVEKMEASMVKVENALENEERLAEEKEAQDKSEAKKQRKKQEAEEKVQKSEASLSEEKVAFLERFAELEEEQENEKEETGGTLQIREFIWGQTEPWDDELNKVYEVIIEHHPNADEIQNEQREWVERVEKETKDIYFKSETGGTVMHVESDQHRFNETKQRAYELVNQYME